MNKTSKYLLIIVIASIFLGGGFLACRNTGNQSNEKTKTDKEVTADKKNGGDKVELLTAKEAWAKVKPEADKWSDNYRIARVSDIDTPSHQRIDGVSLGWKFYLEDCKEYQGGSMGDICKEGKSRSFHYLADDMAGRDAGIFADQESERGTGRITFDPEIWEIDSDEAQDLAREAVGRDRNENEEFQMAIEVTDGVPYWEIGRQCWSKGDRDNCDSSNGYGAYVNIETGEATSEKP
jgi:hypothetical protein